MGRLPLYRGQGNEPFETADARSAAKRGQTVPYDVNGAPAGGNAALLEGQAGAYYLARANHTGTQLAATISNFAEAVDDRVANLLTAGANIGLVYDDGAGTLTVSLTGIGSSIQAYDALLASIATLTFGADSFIYGTGSDTAAAGTITAFGRSLVDDADAAAGRTTLGLGTAAVKNTGTSGDAVPLLNAANTFSAAQTVTNAAAGVTAFSVDGVGGSKLRIDFSGTSLILNDTADFRVRNAAGSSIFVRVLSTGMLLTVPIFESGVQVVGARKTGWATATGTAARTTFATYTAPDISNPPTEAEVQALADHVQILSQRLKALIDDLHATAGHGLIGA